MRAYRVGGDRAVDAVNARFESAVNARPLALVSDTIKANLIGADLIGANLIGANLRGANLSDANLSDADLFGASIENAIITQEQMDTVKFKPTETTW